MSRRFLTAEDVRRAGTKEIIVDSDTVVTPQALEVARGAGITIRTGSGTYREPEPDRGPDAASARLPAMPEPSAESGGTGVIVTCVGRNRPGVLSEVTTTLAEAGVGINDISQKMVGEFFHMVLVAEISEPSGFAALKERLQCLGGEDDYVVRVMHERVFRFMHRI